MRLAAEDFVQPDKLVILSEAKNLFGCFASLNMTGCVGIGNANDEYSPPLLPTDDSE